MTATDTTDTTDTLKGRLDRLERSHAQLTETVRDLRAAAILLFALILFGAILGGV